MTAILLVTDTGDFIVTDTGDFITLGDEGNPVPGRAFRWREPAILDHRDPATLSWREPPVLQGA